MKRPYRLLLILLLLCLFAAGASAQTEGDFSYAVSGGQAKITAYTGAAAEVTVPGTLGGYPVTAIGYCAFRDCRALRKVVLPQGVARIGSNAFMRCTALEELVIPDSVVQIDTHAFYACAALREIALHDDIKRIHSLAFYGCSAARLCAPDSLTAHVLTDVGSSFTDPAHPQLLLHAFEEGGRRTLTVIDCLPAAESVSFPQGVTAIGDYAFFGCDQLEAVVLPEGVVSIGASAFEGCSALRQITLPASVKHIAANAFSGCPELTVIAPQGSDDANGLQAP